ncbi:MAG: hypothetical protein SAL70_20860 [Scytonema sp. PMC 1070.18]|nr:hypothetical protein [Scytonema sp. PMC 1070.18]
MTSPIPRTFVYANRCNPRIIAVLVVVRSLSFMPLQQISSSTVHNAMTL